MARALLLSVCLTAAVSACYSPPEPACGFFCGPNAACPANYHCASDKVCHLDGASDVHCGPDAGVDAFRFEDVAIDVFPPQVVSTTPSASSQAVAVDVPISVTFDEPTVGVDASTFVVTSSSVTLDGTITTSDHMTYIFTPAAPLPASSEIDVQLSTGISDLLANHFPGYFFMFRTQ